jgi:hypothetical protein
MNIFEKKPSQWGLRGDPFLWNELETLFLLTSEIQTEEEFEIWFRKAFEQLTGIALAVNKDIYIQKYAKGGISSGYVSCNFWLDKGLPLLKSRLKGT